MSRAAWIAPLLLALCATACGGDDDSVSTTATAPAPPLTKAEFIRQADEICFSGDSRIEAAADNLLAGGGEPPPAQVRRIALRIVVPGLESELRAIKALGVPEGDQAEVDRILRATQRGIGEIEADPQSAVEGPPPGLREAGRLARAYGSRECGAQ